jgi:hypothetical protein
LFPFLPLPPQFDNQSQREWSSLAQDIQHWLLRDPDFSTTDPHSYSLMQELFWMAFVAVFPTFPFGEWPVWDAQIPMQGSFISQWVTKIDEDSITPPLIARRHVWAKFKALVQEVLHYPVMYL